MNSVLKKVLVAGVALAALVAASGGGLRWWLEGKLSKEAIVAQMESSWNCRAQIDSVTLVLAATPARLEITGCKIAPRDAEVAKPFAQRTPLAEGKDDLSIARAVLEVKLQDLVSRKLNIQQLLLSDIFVSEDVTKEGESSLAVLFSKPTPDAQKAAVVVSETKPAVPPSSEVATLPPSDKTPASVPAAETTPASPAPVKPEAEKKEKKEHEPKVFEASQLGFSIQVNRASLERVAFKRVDHKTTSKTDVTDLNFSITDIDVNPADLATHNSFKVALNGKLKQRGRIGPKEARREVTMAEILLDGDGTINPFDVETGEWKPVSTLRLTLKKDSVLGGFMKLGEAAGKELKKFEDFGIDLSDLPMGGPLLEDANIRVSFQQDRITLLENALFAMAEFEASLEKEGWINATEDDHKMQLRATLGAGLQERISAGAELNAKKIGLGDDSAKTLIKSLSDEKGRLYFDILSTGRFSKPNPKLDTKRLMNRLIESIGGGLLDGLGKKK